MPKVSFIDSSKTDWVVNLPEGENFPGFERVKLGCLMRIANATEAMAKRHTELIDENTRLSDYIKRLQGYLSYERNTVRTLKGQVTKLKNKLAAKG
jgi:hypothetical protein